jgi:hypothetical protein
VPHPLGVGEYKNRRMHEVLMDSLFRIYSQKAMFDCVNQKCPYILCNSTISYEPINICFSEDNFGTFRGKYVLSMITTNSLATNLKQ